MCTICTEECGPPLIPPEQAVVPAPGFLSQNCCPLGTLSPQLMMAEPLSVEPQPEEGHFPPEAPATLHLSVLCVACLLACITAHGNYMSPLTVARLAAVPAKQARAARGTSFTGEPLSPHSSSLLPGKLPGKRELNKCLFNDELTDE